MLAVSARTRAWGWRPHPRRPRPPLGARRLAPPPPIVALVHATAHLELQLSCVCRMGELITFFFRTFSKSTPNGQVCRVGVPSGYLRVPPPGRRSGRPCLQCKRGWQPAAPMRDPPERRCTHALRHAIPPLACRPISCVALWPTAATKRRARGLHVPHSRPRVRLAPCCPFARSSFASTHARTLAFARAEPRPSWQRTRLRRVTRATSLARMPSTHFCSALSALRPRPSVAAPPRCVAQ